MNRLRVFLVVFFIIKSGFGLNRAHSNDENELKRISSQITGLGFAQKCPQCILDLEKFKQSTSDAHLKYRADYWKFVAYKQLCNTNDKDLASKEGMRKLYNQMQLEYPQYANDSRMIRFGLIVRQERISGDPRAERDFALDFLKRGVKNAVFEENTEVKRDYLVESATLSLTNYEYHRLGEEQHAKARQLKEAGASDEEIQRVFTNVGESSYLNSKAVAKLLEENNADLHAINFNSGRIKQQAQDLPANSKAKLEVAQVPPTPPVPTATEPAPSPPPPPLVNVKPFSPPVAASETDWVKRGQYLLIGGGLAGLLFAYWLKRREG